jgi:putative ABC transport system permease protein
MKSLFRVASMAAIFLISGCALMPKRPPYPEPDRLVSVIKVAPAGEEPILDTDFLALRSESQTFESIAAYAFRGLVLTGASEPERVDSAMVSADVFQTLGVKPSLGRALLPEENQARRNRVAVISYNLWQRRFGGDPSLIGATITLDQEPYTVIGVMASDFQFPQKCDAWAPLAFDDEGLRLEDKSFGLEVIARLKPGVTLQQAQAEVSDIARKLERDYPTTNSGRDIKLTALREGGSRTQNGKVLEIKIRRPAKPPVETGKEK